MLSSRLMDLIVNIPKAENHIHIEGSIPWELAFKLAKRNGVKLPVDTVEEMRKWGAEMIAKDSLNGFMICDRTINSVCQKVEDYEETIVELARNASRQNIIYQEYHLDYPLNEERGIPMDVVMEGYRRGKERALKEFGVDIAYIAGIDRTQDPKKGYEFVDALQKYGDLVEAVGMDCEEKGYPCKDHKEAYDLARERGLFLTAHAGEDDSDQNVKDAIEILHVQRIDHGCAASENPELMKYMAEHKIMCAMAPYGNSIGGHVADNKQHPAKILMRNGVPVSISTDDPPYTQDMIQEYAFMLEQVEITEDEMITCARNAFEYSIRGQKYLPAFDKWVEEFKKKYE